MREDVVNSLLVVVRDGVATRYDVKSILGFQAADGFLEWIEEVLNGELSG